MTLPSPVRYTFYLSYARSAPMGTEAPPDTDHTVGELFRRLSDEVRGMITQDDQTAVVGYVDDTNRPPEEWKSELNAVLGRADVFVALYSPKYFITSVPLRERTAYLQRLTRREQALRLLPVLWVPWETWNHPEERAASLTLGAGLPDYATHGLKALCRLAAYEVQYDEVVRRLARRIVDLAGAAGQRRAPAVAIDDVKIPESSLSGMRLSVMALTAEPDWRPFGNRLSFPPAELAANHAERQGMVPRPATAKIEFGSLAEGAVLVLVDPWIADSADGRAMLESAAKRLPAWAVVVAVADDHDPHYRQRQRGLGEVVNDALGGGQRQVRRILDAGELVDRMAAVVQDSRKEYLSTAPVFLPKGELSPMPRMSADSDEASEEDIDG